MARQAKADTAQITFRVPSEWLQEADDLAKALSRPGMEVERTGAFRAAIAKGFEALRVELKLPKKR